MNEVKPEILARETLQTLEMFAGHLINLSRHSADSIDSIQSLKSFQKLLDGIQTFVDTVSVTKSVLNQHHNNEVNVLEADLLSILKDLLEAEKKNDMAYRKDLLMEHLPNNLTEWRESGIKTLIKSSS